MNIPVDHHFTPVFYLKAWAVDNRVIRYYRPQDKVVASPIAPRNTGYEPHLYTLQGVSLEQQAIIETDFFQPVDTKAAEVHKILLAGGLTTLTNQQRVDWARFMMSTQLRNPFAMGELRGLVDQNLRATSNDPAFRTQRPPGEPEGMYEYMEKHQPHVIANAYKEMMPRLIDHEQLGHHLINMHWATIELKYASHALLTGDRPLTNVYGWKDPATVILFPLSPDWLFTATNGPNQTMQVISKSHNTLVKYANNETVRCAVDFVIGDTKSHLTFVERRLRKKGEEPIPGAIGRGRPNCPN